MQKCLEIPKATGPAFSDYATPEDRPVSALAKAFPTPVFYSKVARTVFKASSVARKGRFDDLAWYNASLKIRSAFESCGSKIQIEGTKNIGSVDGPCLYIGNHMSTAETFLMASMILPHHPVTFVVKQALVEYPVFKHIMRSRNPIVVGRVNPREDLKAVLDGGKALLAAGTSLVIFPQKTRQVKFSREGFNSIGVKLAKRAGVPVIPFALRTDAWSNGKMMKDYGPFNPDLPVRFRFAEPLKVEGNGKEENEAIISFIESSLKEWKIL